MVRYGELLRGDDRFVVPQPYAPLSGPNVLAMDYIDARPIDTLASAPQSVRDSAMEALCGLVLRELFGFGFMQTDPNFANFRWRPDEGRLVLLDFGAARPVPPSTTQAYRRLMAAGLSEDKEALRAALIEVGFVSEQQITRHHDAFDRAINVLIDHLGKPGLFDFADRSFVERVRAEAETIASDRSSWHIPPIDTLFVQRKVSGTALLAIRMKARLPLRDMVAQAIGANLTQVIAAGQ